MIEDLFADSARSLASKRNKRGFWTGELSSSALGTAVSVLALRYWNKDAMACRIEPGVEWLAKHANADGGYGDTAASVSNISTSLLSYAALYSVADDYPGARDSLSSVARYLAREGIDVGSPLACEAILDYYRGDYTFSIPILCACALTGALPPDALGRIPKLPFELALFPKRFYRFLNLGVVSYAIPALIAVGIALFVRAPGRGLFCALLRRLRRSFVPRALALLESSQPASGGFLEAIPLTAFVALSLLWAGHPESAVVPRAIAFIERTQREDGSWPIDVNLSTWVTTLAAKGYRGRIGEFISADEKKNLTSHLLTTQYRAVHPFNDSPPGGWGWTDSSGAVPDCDDTPGAVLALLSLNPEPDQRVAESIMLGCEWIAGLQNGNGGFPTFSRGWGRLPFDQSCADLTGHAVAALASTLGRFGNRAVCESGSGRDRGAKCAPRLAIRRALRRAVAYLMRTQRADGSWIPLWFGNQKQPEGKNPVYGTARVCAYLADALASDGLSRTDSIVVARAVINARVFLVSAQNADGSWGGDRGIPGTVEETSLALSALAGSAFNGIERGVAWLSLNRGSLPSAPIGLYFAALWYDEALYPDAFYAEAMARLSEAERAIGQQPESAPVDR